jgi:hypothetical protein
MKTKIFIGFIVMFLSLFSLSHPPVGDALAQESPKIKSSTHLQDKPMWINSLAKIEDQNNLQSIKQEKYNKIMAGVFKSIAIYANSLKKPDPPKLRTKVTPKIQQVYHSSVVISSSSSYPTWHNGRLCGHGCIMGSSPCAIPQYICNRESGGLIDIYNPNGNASGKYQFERGTWNNYMGYRNAADAPESIQDQKAREVYSVRPSAWACC